jgi:signal peptidase II
MPDNEQTSGLRRERGADTHAESRARQSARLTPGVRAMLRWSAFALLLALADQGTKYVVLAAFEPHEYHPITGFFNLVLVYNPGAAFSLLAGAGGWQKWLFMALAFGISVWILRAIAQAPQDRAQNLALTLILGGALGNVVDRFIHGAVVDFLDLHLGAWHWPTFNLADIAITAGAVLLVLDAWRTREKSAPTMNDSSGNSP